MDYLCFVQRGNTKCYLFKMTQNKPINMIIPDVILWGVKSFSLSRTPYTPSDGVAVFHSEGDVWAVFPPALLLYKHEAWWHLSWFRGTELLDVYSFFFFSFCLSIPSCVGSSLPFCTLNALMLYMLLCGFQSGAKVSWLALQLSSARQQLKWTCSESTLKNYFSVSRR